jgi:Fe-S-cluster-containing dehydrogenase component
MNLMMKCDMCYDRTSVGKKPMCASVCPSQALYFGTRDEIEKLRPRSRSINQFQFGNQTISTKVNMMIPKSGGDEPLDVTAAMYPAEVDGNVVDDPLMANLQRE